MREKHTLMPPSKFVPALARTLTRPAVSFSLPPFSTSAALASRVFPSIHPSIHPSMPHGPMAPWSHTMVMSGSACPPQALYIVTVFRIVVFATMPPIFNRLCPPLYPQVFFQSWTHQQRCSFIRGNRLFVLNYGTYIFKGLSLVVRIRRELHVAVGVFVRSACADYPV